MAEHTRTRQGIKGHVIVLAVDVAKRGHWMLLQGPDGTREPPRRIANTAAGFATLLQHAAAARGRWPEAPLVVALEPTGHYWLPLAYWLQARGVPIPYPLSLMLPHLLTLGVLAVASLRTRAPADLGRPYRREGVV